MDEGDAFGGDARAPARGEAVRDAGDARGRGRGSTRPPLAAGTMEWTVREAALHARRIWPMGRGVAWSAVRRGSLPARLEEAAPAGVPARGGVAERLERWREAAAAVSVAAVTARGRLALFLGRCTAALVPVVQWRAEPAQQWGVAVIPDPVQGATPRGH
ncbi:hypothetical protein GCM10027168_73310 [Streptomyces capparidis]